MAPLGKIGKEVSLGLEKEQLTEEEREAVTIVFHQFETGLREGTIYAKVMKHVDEDNHCHCQDLLDALKSLGLNPGEQEVIDMTNEVAVGGLVYFPDFCRIVLRKYREENNRDNLNQQLFKVRSTSSV